MFDKILIANRGEIALRILRAAKELGIATVAVHSTADADAMHVRLADESVCIGPPSARDSYLNIPSLIAACEISGADAVHPGYGFLSENARFAEILDEHGITFIGPTAEHIRIMGDKIEAKRTAARLGIPTVPGSEGAVEDEAEARRIADAIGYPVLIKASAGGGGKGMRLVERAEDLRSSFERVTSEAASFFGDASVYAEKFVTSPRHIEVQVVGDQHGNIVHVGERECTLQRRHQKVVEESPSPVVDAELRAQLGAMAVKAAAAVNYYSTGTIECLMGADRNFYFLEMNTRLQVEHPVTEMVWGVDLVKEQLRIAQGEKLSFRQEDLRPTGHAIECRVYAEDPARNFAPSPGLIRYISLPQGPGVRNDQGVYAGYTVPVFYDPMLSKLIVHGPTREEAIARMRRALDEYRVEGISTTIPFFTFIMNNPDFIDANFDTGYIDRILPTIDFAHDASEMNTDAAIAAAAILAFEQAQNVKLPEDAPSRWRDAGRVEALRGRM